jgi:hypothetical protein
MKLALGGDRGFALDDKQNGRSLASLVMTNNRSSTPSRVKLAFGADPGSARADKQNSRSLASIVMTNNRFSTPSRAKVAFGADPGSLVLTNRTADPSLRS